MRESSKLDRPQGATSVQQQSRALVDAKGLPWLRDAISIGQYTHPDSVHFGGAHTEQSTHILAEVVSRRLAGASTSRTVELHSGHGQRGSYTLLSSAPVGSDDDR